MFCMDLSFLGVCYILKKTFFPRFLGLFFYCVLCTAETYTWAIMVTVDDVVTKVVPSVSSKTFSVLWQLHKKEFETFEEDGVRIYYNESKGEIELHGKTGRVGKALVTVQGFGKGLLTMQTEKIRIVHLNKHMAIKVLEKWRSDKNTNCYIYDGRVHIVKLFANTSKDIEKAKFDLSHSSLDFICKSLNEMTPSE